MHKKNYAFHTRSFNLAVSTLVHSFTVERLQTTNVL